MVRAAPFLLLPARDFGHAHRLWLPLPGAGREGASCEADQRDRRWAFPSQGLGVFTGLSPLRAVPQSPGGPPSKSRVCGLFQRGCDLKKTLLARSAGAGASTSKGRVLPKSTPLWCTKVCHHGRVSPLHPGVRPWEPWDALASGGQ